MLFSRTPQINRGNRDEPYAALPWEDLDSLFTAMLGDLLESVSQGDFADVLLYRDASELSDDFLGKLREKIDIRNVSEGSFSEQVQQAIETVFSQGYDRVVAILDNHPLITSEMIRKVFDQLGYEDDCVVVGPTMEGKYFLLGMKSSHSEVFDITEGNPMTNSNLLLERLCRTNAILFPITMSYALDSGFNLARLKKELDALGSNNVSFPHRTHEIFKTFDKKYRTRKSTR